MLKTVCGAAFGALLLLGSPASARTLSPVDDWQLAEGDENCRLARAFGEGEERTTLQIQSYGPQTPYQVLVRGALFPIRDNRAMLLDVRLGDGEEQEVMGVLGMSGDRPLLRFALAPPRGIHIFARFYSYQPTSAMLAARLEPSADVLTINMVDMEPITFRLGPMAVHYAVLDECAEGLAAKRGDAPGHLAAQPPQLIEGQELAWRIKYPQNLLLNRISGLVYLRTVVGEDGRMRDCTVQAPNWGSRFERDTCRTLERWGRFEPARDHRGVPVAAPFATAVFFIIYNW